jgi:hypothetical protein
VRLQSIDVAADAAPLPRDVASLLADAGARIDAYVARHAAARGASFVPSDHEQVWRALRTLRRVEPGRTFCEWGSGFGVATGLAALLGFDATGIECDAGLVALSRELLAAHRLAATIVRGSFVPDEYARSERRSALATRTVLSAAAAYDDLDLAIDDFAVVFGYPWPDDEDLYRDVFRRHADHGAVLLLWSATEGMRAWRKV